MKVSVNYNGENFHANLNQPLDISMAVRDLEEATRAWYVDKAKIEPIVMGDWVGSVESGAGVNFNEIYFSPHAHGTHTETLGHVTLEKHSIDRRLEKYFFTCRVISCELDQHGKNQVVNTQKVLDELGQAEITEALVLRTTPNDDSKLHTNYSNTNPPFIEPSLAKELARLGVNHLLIDTPSVDPEEDGGALLSHHAFWATESDAPRVNATISELIYVPNHIPDGVYLLELQIAPIVNDAAPSRPLLYPLTQ